MKVINRDLFFITPKQPFFDWYLRTFPLDPVFKNREDFHDNSTMFLIPEFNNDEEALDWLKSNWDEWFVVLMEGWCTDESLWPSERSLKLLNDFFEISYQSHIFDSVNSSIIKDR
jgi:hypothetical protein